MATRNVVLFRITIGFFITGGILFILDRPYWYYSIPVFTVAILIPLVAWMWSIAGWADDTMNRWTGKNLDPNNDPKEEV